MFGLFVLSVFYSVFIDAQTLPKNNPSNIARTRYRIPSRVRVPQQPPILSLTPRTTNTHLIRSQPSVSNLARLKPKTSNSILSRPAHSSQTSLNSMSNVNLHSSSSSSSLTSLNGGGSPSIMREITHQQAASALNAMGLRPNSAPIIHRMIPDLSNIRRNIGKYLQTGAIAVAGTGGAIQIAEVIKGDECCEEKKEQKQEEKKEQKQEENIMNDKRNPTKSPEFYNSLGVDK